MTDDKRITVIVDDDTHQAAKEKALKEKRSLSDVIRDLLLGWLKDPKQEDERN